jgi:hypothetical protein
MTPNSAYSLVNIVEGVDYTQAPTTSMVGPVSVQTGLEPPIYALLCTKGGTSGNIEIQLLGMGSPISIPATTFKQGVVYYMYLKKLVDDNSGDVTFVGFRYANSPAVY